MLCDSAPRQTEVGFYAGPSHQGSSTSLNHSRKKRMESSLSIYLCQSTIKLYYLFCLLFDLAFISTNFRSILLFWVSTRICLHALMQF